MPQVLQSSFVAIGDNTLDVYIEQGVMFAGGNALNVAAQWALMGLPARYIGAVGRDTEAGHVLSGLRESGLHIEDVVTCEGHTGFTVVRLVNQDRQFLVDEFGVSATWSPTSAEVSSLQEASWVHVAGPLVSTELARDLATSRARVSIDLSTNHDVPSLAGIDIAFASNGDARDPSAEALARRILDAGAAEAVVTLSEHPNIVAIKESSGNLEKLMKMIREVKTGFQVLSGSAPTLYPSLKVGAVGAVLAFANAGSTRKLSTHQSPTAASTLGAS